MPNTHKCNIKVFIVTTLQPLIHIHPALEDITVIIKLAEQTQVINISRVSQHTNKRHEHHKAGRINTAIPHSARSTTAVSWFTLFCKEAQHRQKQTGNKVS